jgi:hypothetical protein
MIEATGAATGDIVHYSLACSHMELKRGKESIYLNYGGNWILESAATSLEYLGGSR